MTASMPRYLICLFSLFFIRAEPPFSTIEYEYFSSHSFGSGEQLRYSVSYTLGGAAIKAGEAHFETLSEPMNGQTVFHVVATGRTLPFYDPFFKVRDRYETYMDTASLRPYRFIRRVSEGNYTKYEHVTFNKDFTAICDSGLYKLPADVKDVVSAMYSLRNVDYSKLSADVKLPFILFLGNTLYRMYVRYVGREIVSTSMGRFNAIKLKPLLLKSAAFRGGETMTIWISDDANRIPLRIESEVSVGSIVAELDRFEKIRYPLSSAVK